MEEAQVSAAMTDHDSLLSLISEVTGIDKTQLADEKSLFHDFGVAGLDGAELLDEIGTRFGIDMSEVDCVRYFGEELPYSPVFHLSQFLRGRRLDDGIVRLQVSDLKRTVTERKWQDPTEPRTG